MLEKILIFIAFLCPLIFFHELGHYLFAKLFGVRVEVFSIGFGPKLFKFRKFDTQFAVSLIPLGGYVKMFGDDPLSMDEIPEEERPYSFTHKGKWPRFWVVFGGPFANFVLSYFIFFCLLLSGEKVPEARFGVMPESSPYYSQGIRTGDLLKSVNGKEVLGLTDLAISSETEKIQNITVQRGDELKSISTNVELKQFLEDFISYPQRFRKPIFVDKTGQKFLLTTDTNKLTLDRSIEEIVQDQPSMVYLSPIKEMEPLSVNMDQQTKLSLQIKKPADVLVQLRAKGFYPLDLKVASIVTGSPANDASILGGNILVSFNGIPLYDFEDLRLNLQGIKKGEVIKLGLRSKDGKKKEVSLVPEAHGEGENLRFTVGVYTSGEFIQLRMVESKSKGFFQSLLLAHKRTWETITKTISGFKKLLTNEVSIKTIGGPIAIGKVASDSLSISLSYFFNLMALISVNLGIINLFPVPVLDGGHILFIFLEIANRGPLSRRKIEIAQQFGLSLLFFLIFISLYNDITRLFR